MPLYSVRLKVSTEAESPSKIKDDEEMVPTRGSFAETISETLTLWNRREENESIRRSVLGGQ